MKRTAYILTVIALTLSSVSPVIAASSKVYINNNVNSGYNSYSSSQTNTKVEIHQEGDGTSSVKINGKEWKLEGPGDITVNESSGSDDSDASSLIVQKDEVSPTPTETPSPTPTEEESAEVLGESNESNYQPIGNIIENFIVACRKFLTKYLVLD